MPTTKITILRNGRPVQYVQVSLEYRGLTQMGLTKKYSTDRDGIAYIEHSSTGRAYIWVDGKERGSMMTPGVEVVEVP